MKRFARPVSATLLSLALVTTPLLANRVVAQRPGWKSAATNSNPFRGEQPGEWTPSRDRLINASSVDSTAPPSAGSLASVRSAQSAPSNSARIGAVQRPHQPVARPSAAVASKTESNGFVPPRSQDRPVLRHSDPSRRSEQTAHSAAPHDDADPRWLLPNHHGPQAASHTSRPRQTAHKSLGSTSESGPREPRHFIPPKSAEHVAEREAAPVVSENTPQATIANARRTDAPQNAGLYSGSAAVSHVAAHIPAPPEPRAAAPRRNTTLSSTASAHRSHSQGRPASRSNSYANRLYDSFTVAFEGPEAWAAFEEGEELPTPGARNGTAPRQGLPRNADNLPMLQEEGGYEIVEGPVFSDGYAGCSDGMCYGEAGYGGECDMCACGDACEPGCGCGAHGSHDLCSIGCGDDESCHSVRIRLPKWKELMLFGGVQGFKGPYDQSRDSGNFGFHEGFNAGFKVPYTTMGYQIGYQAVQSQLSGDKDTDISDPHTQQFFTAGIFQRTVHGFQGGAVYDVLRDERWGAVDFHQIRAEVSYIDNGCHELGFAGAFHLNQHEAASQDDLGTTIWQAADQYLLFYRFHGRRGGEGRFYAGVNDDSDAIIGSDMMLPLTDRWSLQPAFTYMIPDEDGGEVGAAQEAWNIGIAMVWHWDCRARKCYSSSYRPLFNVANNGYLIVDDRPGAGANGAAASNDIRVQPLFP